MDRRSYQRLIAYLACALLLFGAGWYAHQWHAGSGSRPVRRVALRGHHLTSPLLDVELSEGLSIHHEPIPFKHRIVSLVQQLVAKGSAREIAVYYRDLHDGPWFGINENVIFSPASMLKVPVMIAWLKRAEKDPKTLQRTFVYDLAEDMSAIQKIRPERTIVRGRRYTVAELLDFMLRYSDNNATALLYNGLPAEELNAVLDSMDVENQIMDDTNAMTVHGYSGFYRILYNSSFLSREMSEKALELLSHQDFPHGIVAGIPSGTTVASKYGEIVKGHRGEEKQLHEFGIVYHPAHPYILGIMTRGSDFTKQQEVLAAISREVYQSVDTGGAIRK